MTDRRVAHLNVPCTGKFEITVDVDGYWEVKLVANDGNTYYRSRGTMLRSNLIMDHHNLTSVELPEWMWNAINNKLNDLTIMFARGSLNTPILNEAYV